MRTSIRRLTRLTNAFSKKWEHLKAMFAVYFAFYNLPDSFINSLHSGNGSEYNYPRLGIAGFARSLKQ